jgi:hypothetical protein
MDLNKVSLGIGGTTAKPIGAHTTDHGSAKATGAGAGVTPRDNSGALSSGETAGGFKFSGMTQLPNNAGPAGTESGAAEAQAAFASAAQ